MYWASEQAIENWRRDAEHLEAQRLGRKTWYSEFKVQIAKVEQAYGS